MVNHLPGRAHLSRDDLMDSQLKNKKRYSKLFSCFKNPKTFYANTLRLFNRKECKAFFKLSNKKRFRKMMKRETLYTVKNLDTDREISLDFEELQKLNTKYNSGKLCGKLEAKLFMREYIWNQLHYKNGHKFRLRTFLVVASTQPLLVLFNPGFVVLDRFRNSLPFPSRFLGLEDFRAFLNKDRGITRSQFDSIYREIKSILALLNFIVYKKFLQDPRFFQVFTVDFIVDDKLNPWLVNVQGSPDYKHQNLQFVNNLIKLINQINLERSSRILARVSKVKHVINQRIFDRSLEVKYWSKFVPEIKKIIKGELRNLNNLKRNKIPSSEALKDLDFEVIFDGTKKARAAFKGFIPDHCL